MTPDEFRARMQHIIDTQSDKQSAHEAADDLVVQALKEAGFEEGATIYDEATENWWYA